MMRQARQLWLGIYLIPLAFLCVFYVYPLLSILDVSLRPAGALDLSGFVRLLSGDYYFGTLIFTVYQAVLSTAFTLLLATPCAFVFARYRFPGKSLLLSLATLPFVLPTVVVALAFATLLGKNGLLNDLIRTLFSLDYRPIQLERTLAMIIIVHVFYNFAVALRIMTSYWSSVGIAVEEAARCLGADEWALWREIRLPLIRPALLSAGALVFIFSFTSFGVILILGGIRFATLEVQIYYQAVNMFNLPLAAALSLVQILSMLAMMILYTSTQKKLHLALASGKANSRRALTVLERLAVGSCVGLISVLLLAPLIALASRSLLASGRLDFANYASLTEKSRGSLLFIAPLDAVFNSLRFALIAMIAALVLGIIASYLIQRPGRLARLADPLFMLPLATSAVTLGFGFIIALDEPPLNLRASWLIIPISHTLVALPFVMRSVLPSLRAIPPSLREAAQTLGAKPIESLLTIDLPLLGRASQSGQLSLSP